VPSPEETPSGICECGCGKPTPIYEGKNARKRRAFKGYPAARLPGHNNQGSGPDNHNWRGGETRTMYGYINQYAPDHPNVDKKGYVKQHRLVMEAHLGRLLERSEHVHHINGIKHDNRLQNLIVMTQGEHNNEHAGERRYDSAKMSAAGKKGAAARWGTKP
jgi:hypothetical protein